MRKGLVHPDLQLEPSSTTCCEDEFQESAERLSWCVEGMEGGLKKGGESNNNYLKRL